MTAVQSETLQVHLTAEAQHDAAAAAAVYAPAGFYENVALGVRFEGRDLVEAQYGAPFEFINEMTATYDWEQTVGEVVVQCGRITGSAGTELLGVPCRGGALDFPFTAVIVFRDGVMLGEHLHYDLELFCEQAGLDVVELRSAAAGLFDPATGKPQ